MQIGQIEQQHSLLVGIEEHDIEHAFLRLVQIEQAGEHRERLAAARVRLADCLPDVAAQFSAAAHLREVPGLIEAGLGRSMDESEALGLDALTVVPAPVAALDVLRGWAQRPVERAIDANAVHGSDASDTARHEVGFFFPGMNVYSRLS